MAFCCVTSACIQGLQVEMIRVEADISNGLPMLHMVGYLSSEVKEAADRVRTALRNADVKLPPKKIMVNLAPATLRKKGASYDLPIAVSILAALGMIPPGRLENLLIVGELSLDGSVKKVPGILPVVWQARKAGLRACIVPEGNGPEGALAEGIPVIGVSHIRQLLAYLNGEIELCPFSGEGAGNVQTAEKNTDFSEVRGQQAVKRAAEVAAAGGHNLLLVGPPGSGKSMIARRIPTILPPPAWEESLEMTSVYSVLGLVDERRPLITERPFREVHHTVTKAALIGGGRTPSPGEISLAHGGVLFTGGTTTTSCGQ